MKKELKQNSDIIANTIRMKRTQLKTQVFILVEGDSDKRFFKKFFHKETTHLEIAWGRKNLLEVLEKLKEDDKLIAIKDADFDWVNYYIPTQGNLFITDFYDVENLMLHSPALDTLITEHAGEEKLNKFEQSQHTLLELIIEAGKPLGYLRLLNDRSNMGLKFENLRYKDFIDINSLKINVEHLIQAVKNKSQKPQLDAKQLLTDLNDLARSLDSLDHNLKLCCGHDLTEILSLAFAKLLGTSGSDNKITRKDIESDLRLAYHFSYFKQTKLYQNLVAWASAKGLRIFIESEL